MKRSLIDHFGINFVCGSCFVDAEDEDREKLLEVGKMALSEVSNARAQGFLVLRLK